MRDVEPSWPELARFLPDIVITSTCDGTILKISRTVIDRAPEDMIGQDMRGWLDPGHVAVFEETLERVARTGRPDSYQVLGSGPGGPSTAWYETLVVPVIHDGATVAVTHICNDVTDRRGTAERLRHSEALWRSLMVTSPDAICVSDTSGRITFASDRAAELFGYETGEQMQGKTCFDLIVPEQLQQAKEEYAAAWPIRSVKRSEYSFLRKDGSTFIGETSVGLAADADGHPYALIASVRDVTARKQAERERARLEEQLRLALEAERDALAEETARLRAQLESSSQRGTIIGQDRQMHAVFEVVETAGPTNASVLIQGETGTGKELVARAIHDASLRNDKPFVKVDCGALVGGLLESELFGHVKGAFTDAVRNRRGRVETAQGGTLFLDEVQNLRSDLQSRLLRLTEDGTFERVGSSATQEADVRIIAATNEDLEALVAAGSFRRDLFYRLNVVTLLIPPLRERAGDIPLLAEAFMRHYADRHGREVNGMTRQALDTLMAHRWPGNVRELENVIEQAVVLARSEMIGPDDIRLPPGPNGRAAAPSVGRLSDAADATERQMLEDALARTRGNRKRAAEQLGISRSSLYEKLRKHGLMTPMT